MKAVQLGLRKHSLLPSGFELKVELRGIHHVTWSSECFCHCTVRSMPKYDTFYSAGLLSLHMTLTVWKLIGTNSFSSFQRWNTAWRFNLEALSRRATVQTKCATVQTSSFILNSFSFIKHSWNNQKFRWTDTDCSIKGDAVNFQKHNEQFSRGWKNCTVHSEQRVKQTRGAQVSFFSPSFFLIWSQGAWENHRVGLLIRRRLRAAGEINAN